MAWSDASARWRGVACGHCSSVAVKLQPRATSSVLTRKQTWEYRSLRALTVYLTRRARMPSTFAKVIALLKNKLSLGKAITRPGANAAYSPLDIALQPVFEACLASLSRS